MSHFLIITSGLTGILNASFELTNRLQREGHSCTLASPAQVKEFVRKEGFEYVQLNPTQFDPAPDLPNFHGSFVKIKRLFYKIKNHKERREAAILNLGMDSFMLQMRELKPDVVLVDVELHEHIMTLVRSEFKVVLLSQWFSTWKRPGLPPIIHDTIPGVGFAGSKLGMYLAWKSVELKRWKMFFKKKIATVYTDRRSILQAYAKQIGFSKRYIPQNYWPGPFTYDLLPVLSMTDEALEFPHKVRPNMSYIGSMVYADRKDYPNDVQLDYEHLKRNGKQLIYCSVSTFSNGDVSFLKKLMAAVSDKNDWNLVISTGNKLKPEVFGSVPENVYLVKRVNQIKVLANCNLSINHGGIHTINECLHFKVPMLVYSGKRSDQNGCAARIQYHGVGVMADKDKDDANTIAARIALVLTNDAIKKNLKKNSEGNISFDDQNTLSKTVQSLLKNPKE